MLLIATDAAVKWGKITGFATCVLLFVEGDHLNGSYGALGTLVAETSAATVEGLLDVVGCEEAEYEGDVVAEVKFGYTVGRAGAYVVEVGGVAANNRAEAYHSVGVVLTHHHLGTGYKLETAWDVIYLDVGVACAMFDESVDSAIEEVVGDIAVPL